MGGAKVQQTILKAEFQTVDDFLLQAAQLGFREGGNGFGNYNIEEVERSWGGDVPLEFGQHYTLPLL